jgi:hypothetical protein
MSGERHRARIALLHYNVLNKNKALRVTGKVARLVYSILHRCP